MILAVDIWFLPAVAAGSASYLVSLGWERWSRDTAPSPLTEAFLASLSFVMGALSGWYRGTILRAGPENNVIVMFIAGATTTYLWLLFRRYMPGGK